MGNSSATGSFAKQTASFVRSDSVIRAFYACLLFFVLESLRSWSFWIGVKTVDPPEIVSWMAFLKPFHAWVLAICCFAVSTLIVCFWPTIRLARIACFLSLLHYVGLVNAFGKISHDLHMWLWVTGVFLFLPTFDPATVPNRRVRQIQLLVFWWAQACVLLFYSMAGSLKIANTIIQMANGQVNHFSPSGASTLIAERLLRTNSESLLGRFFVEHPMIAWPAHSGAVLLEFSCLFWAFRLRLHRYVGAALIGMHAAIGLVMDIWFERSFLLLGILFLCSPFASPGFLRFR